MTRPKAGNDFRDPRARIERDEMAFATLRDGAKISYQEFGFYEPWTTPETIVMVHGFCRNSAFWYAWIPVLARRFRVLCLDLRGCGGSDVPAAGFSWSLQQLNDDLMDFMDATGTARAHFVGESMGGMVMPWIYQRSGARIQSITACSSNVGLRAASFAKEMAGGAASMTEAITLAPTLQHYIRKTEGSRLAADEVSEQAKVWYADEWAKTSRRVWQEWSEQLVPTIDVTPELLKNIDCPLLFFGPSRCVKLPLEEARYWTEHAPHSRLEIIDSASQALAFAKAEICASITRDFLVELSN
jgi:pimeloyl-ACP methyl ester carboxylesterase